VSQITLFSATDGPSGKAKQIDGHVVGHDSIIGDDNKVRHTILLLPGETCENRHAIWGTLDMTGATSIRCTLQGDPTVYTVQQFDYHSSSPAFRECQNIVTYLTRHAKCGPFMEPVDPVALNIPQYFDIVKKPMDIGTLSANLEKGIYSNIAPSQSIGRNPITRMLNGPFRKDVELIFDNAMMFNPPDDWIHLAADAIKKGVMKKIEQASLAAEEKSSGRSSRQNRSIYVDEDSDADIYVYTSDQDEEFVESRNRKRKRGSKQAPKEDVSSRAVERTIRLQKIVNESAGLSGQLANLPANSDASSFSLPTGWDCHYKETNGAALTSVSDQDKELDELISLHRQVELQETSGLRRSTRAHGPEDGPSGGGSKPSSANVEYIPPKGLTKQVDKLPSSRLEIEALGEKLHEEFFARVFKDKVSMLKPIEDDSKVGMSADGFFPPYLGRVVHVTGADDVSWEIRPQYILAAVKWVLRGLIRSDHLGEVEPMTSDSGVIIANHIYYVDHNQNPFDVIDNKELNRRKRADQEANASSEEEIELSEYEKARAERVARNEERLRALGLA
jgi:hypothetical protein